MIVFNHWDVCFKYQDVLKGLYATPAFTDNELKAIHATHK